MEKEADRVASAETAQQIPDQGGHGTGNLDVNFSRQGKHREFGYKHREKFENTGKNF